MGLGEPKKRIKYSVDPNVLSWANDESKFGKRLMEQMGWEKGKGLGAKGTGIVENIKVKFKDDSKGIGYDNKGYENVWLDHQDSFDSLLAQLKVENSDQQTSTTTLIDDTLVQTSLEEKSKHSRARVHYRKFTRSKDLTNASANDLDCILGRQKRQQLKAIKLDENNDSSESVNVNEEKNLSSQPPHQATTTTELESSFKTIINPLSMNDYFASKMAQLNKKRQQHEQMTTDEPTIEFIAEECIIETKKKSKKVKQQVNEETQPEIELEQRTESIEIEEVAKKKKKSKQQDLTETEQQETGEEAVKKKKKSKKKEKSINDCVEENGNHVAEMVMVEAEEVAIVEETSNNLVINGFPGSNLHEVRGYTPYSVNSNLDAIISEKKKRSNRKRDMLLRKLADEPNLYESKKMPMVNLNLNNELLK